MMEWLGQNIQYPKEAVDAKVEGRVMVSFVIEKDFRNIRCEQNVKICCDCYFFMFFSLFFVYFILEYDLRDFAYQGWIADSK